MNDAHKMLVVESRACRFPAARLAELLGAECAPSEPAPPRPAGPVLLLDPVPADHESMVALAPVLACIHPDAHPESLAWLGRARREGVPCRLAVPSPVHHLFAIERLGFPAADVDLIPAGIDPPDPGEGVPERDPGRLLVVGFEGSDERIANPGAYERDAKVQVVSSADREALARGLRQSGVALVAARDRDAAAGTEELLLAMASGCAVVATRTFGLEHLLDDEHEGLLVTPGDAADAREAVRRLLGDPELAASLGNRAAAKVRHGLTLRHQAERLRHAARQQPGTESPAFFHIAAHTDAWEGGAS